MMYEIFAFLCLIAGLILLVILSAIDLKTCLLPNIYNAGLAFFGLLFHLFTTFTWLTPTDIFMGAAVGGGMLFGIRLVANRLYQQDTLGLGDVKLLAAGGLWLGPQGVLMAITIGAMAGLIHGAGVLMYNRIKTGKAQNMSHFSIPAGPGFAVGIVIAALVQYRLFITGGFS